jgi:hypothetical protein
MAWCLVKHRDNFTSIPVSIFSCVHVALEILAYNLTACCFRLQRTNLFPCTLRCASRRTWTLISWGGVGVLKGEFYLLHQLQQTSSLPQQMTNGGWRIVQTAANKHDKWSLEFSVLILNSISAFLQYPFSSVEQRFYFVNSDMWYFIFNFRPKF